jgi:hypothetical protein
MSQDFEKRTRELLDESTRRLDGRTQSRLTQARHAALEQSQRPARTRWNLFLPAGAAAAAAVLAVFMWVGRPSVISEPAAVDDIDMIADADASAIIESGEDLEFYEWAAGELET